MSEVSQELLDKYRDINTDHDWWGCIYANFRERMAAKRIEVEDIYFSGFWSQGDGACFNGSIMDMSLYLNTFHNDDEFPMLRKLLQHDGDVWAKWRTEGRYCHENSLRFTVDSDTLWLVVNCRGNYLREAVVDAWDAARELELDALEQSVKENVQQICRTLYRQLEEEYEYLTSDEAVAEAIIANELNDEEE